MDILLTGGSGQVGTALGALSWPDGVRLHAPPRAALDLADPASVRRALEGGRYGAVVSAGAYTAVDRAESDVETAWRVNALAPAILAEITGRDGIPLIHLSTDYVFDGSKAGPYREDDPVGPVGVYGASKAGGEAAVRTANRRHAILRTAWIHSAAGANFVRTMLRLAAEREEVAVVADQQGCPTAAPDLARAVAAVTLALAASPHAPAGTFHAAGQGETSWAGFAEAIFAGSRRRGGPSARVRRIAAADYRTAARRPGNSRLDTTKLRDAFGIALRPWPEALDDVLDELLGPASMPVDGEPEA